MDGRIFFSSIRVKGVCKILGKSERKMVDISAISAFLPKWFNDMGQLNKILVVVIGIICICIALLMLAKAYPGKIKFLDRIVDKIFPSTPESDGSATRTKGCKDADALNYDEDADEGDDTLCDYPNEVVSGFFKMEGDYPPEAYVDKIDGSLPKAASLEECVEIAKTENSQNATGIIVAGLRNQDWTSGGSVALANTCFFYTKYDSAYVRNEWAADKIHTMTCVNAATKFEDCM